MPSVFVPDILDAFTRADAASLGANWTTAYAGGSLKVASNRALAQDAADRYGNVWNVSTYGPDLAVIATIPDAAPPDGEIMLRHDNGVGGPYLSQSVNDAGGGNIVCAFADSGVGIGSSVTVKFTSGMRIVAVAIGNELQTWLELASGWQLVNSYRGLLSRMDAAYVGLSIGFTATNGWDNFGAVTLGSAPAEQHRGQGIAA